MNLKNNNEERKKELAETSEKKQKNPGGKPHSPRTGKRVSKMATGGRRDRARKPT